MIFVIAFYSIKIFIDWAHQNDRQNLIFMKSICVVNKKMAGNGLKRAISSIVRFVSNQSLGGS